MLTVENVYERRPRRKMLQDPVTGEINTNPKRSRQSKKDREIATGTKDRIAKQDKYLDLRPLNKFHSKLLGSTSRLSVSPSFPCIELVLYGNCSLEKVVGGLGLKVFSWMGCNFRE